MRAQGTLLAVCRSRSNGSPVICTTRLFRKDIKSWCKRLFRWAADQTIIGALVSIDASLNRPSCKPYFSTFWQRKLSTAWVKQLQVS